MESTAKQSVEETLEMARKYAQQTSNKALLESVKRISKNCADLVKVGYLNENDNYAQLRKDAIQVCYLWLFIFYLCFLSPLLFTLALLIRAIGW